MKRNGPNETKEKHIGDRTEVTLDDQIHIFFVQATCITKSKMKHFAFTFFPIQLTDYIRLKDHSILFSCGYDLIRMKRKTIPMKNEGYSKTTEAITTISNMKFDLKGYQDHLYSQTLTCFQCDQLNEKRIRMMNYSSDVKS